VRTIELTQGQVALVDDEDYDWLVAMGSWYAHRSRNTFYAKRRSGQPKLRMHRVIMGVTDPATKVDHEDCNGLNNQRSNLRVATTVQNARNRGKTSANTSGYKGVTWVKNDRRWKAQIMVAGKQIFLGNYTDPASAAAAYDAASIKLHGEFAKPNKGESS
jgi:hypothetical protein